MKNYWESSESDADMSAGAIVSNVTDMIQYVRLQMLEQPEYLSIAHEVLAEVNATTASNGKMGIRIDDVGAGWMIDNENNIIWHNVEREIIDRK